VRYDCDMRTGLLPTLILLPWFPVAPACAGRAPVDVGPTTTRTWEVRYSDGSGNRTSIWSDPAGAGWAYDPVQPIESSSGTYSGGDPATGVLTADQAAAVLAVFDDAAKNGKPVGDGRPMGTGQVTILRGDVVQEAVIDATSAQRALEAILAAQLGR
jgi:hypothetical protein